MPEIRWNRLTGEGLAQTFLLLEGKLSGRRWRKGLVSHCHLSYEDFIHEAPRRKLRGSRPNRSGNRSELRGIHFIVH